MPRGTSNALPKKLLCPSEASDEPGARSAIPAVATAGPRMRSW
jgi:hypothetical protein